MGCPVHTNYRGLRHPRAFGERGTLCEDCLSFYAMNKRSGVKENRVRAGAASAAGVSVGDKLTVKRADSDSVNPGSNPGPPAN